jgi:hypothetical protein
MHHDRITIRTNDEYTNICRSSIAKRVNFLLQGNNSFGFYGGNIRLWLLACFREQQKTTTYQDISHQHVQKFWTNIIVDDAGDGLDVLLSAKNFTRREGIWQHAKRPMKFQA